MKTVYLAPPKITPATLLQKQACTRPTRTGCFNISLEKRGSHIIVHCYGHGGAGWTTLWGSINQAIDLLRHSQAKGRIRIVGAGCMGLTAATELNRLGYDVSGITAQDLYDTPSWRAAGYFATLSTRTSPEEMEKQETICQQSFEAVQAIEKGHHPFLSANCVRMMPVYCAEGVDNGLDALEKSGHIPIRQPVTLDFGNGVSHPNYFEYQTYFINTSSIMQQLLAKVHKLGIPIQPRSLQSFETLDEPVIFNCAGMGARQLNDDRQLVPIRGHLITLNSQSGTEHMDYMIYTTVPVGDKQEYLYLFPKTHSVSGSLPEGVACHGVLGGTFDPNVDDDLSPEELVALDERQYTDLLNRSSLFFTGQPFNAKAQHKKIRTLQDRQDGRQDSTG